MITPRNIMWVDGVNSAVAGYLAMAEVKNLIFAHCEMGDSIHKDNHRFIDDLEQWYGRQIIRLRSEEYANVDEVIEGRRYLSGPNGAPCTGAMKIVPRLNFQVPSDTHFWGYAADRLDAKRFTKMQEDYPALRQRSPLIEAGMTKRMTHDFLAASGIRRPYVYDIGMPNGNCLCCVKSSSPRYWAHQRKYFPEVFARRNAQARKFGAKIVILRREKDARGKWQNVRGYPDEVPLDHPIAIKAADFGGGCGFHCPN